MKDFCALCLSIDRNLYLINQELLDVLIPLLKASNFSIFKLTGQVLNICWECRAKLKGINSFRNMALRGHTGGVFSIQTHPFILTSLKYMIKYWNDNVKDKHPDKSYSKLSTSHMNMKQVLNVKEGETYLALGNDADYIVKKEKDLDIYEIMINTDDPLGTEDIDNFERNSLVEPGNTESSTADDSNMDEEMECSLMTKTAEHPENWRRTRAENLREIAMGYNKTAQAREYSKRMWERVTASLNAQEQGAFKSWKDWSSYWVDYKSKLRRRVAAVRLSQNRIRGHVPPLNEIEQKYLSILEKDYGTGLPNIEVDPLAPGETTCNVSQDDTIEVSIRLEEPIIGAGLEVEQEEILQEEITQQEEITHPAVSSSSLHAPRPSKSRQRRRRETPHITKKTARSTLVQILKMSKKRLAFEKKNTETMILIHNSLNKIAEKINRYNKKKSQTREELLRRKRETERRRYAKIRSDPEKYAACREKNKQKYLKERATGVRKTVAEMKEREKM